MALLLTDKETVANYKAVIELVFPVDEYMKSIKDLFKRVESSEYDLRRKLSDKSWNPDLDITPGGTRSPSFYIPKEYDAKQMMKDYYEGMGFGKKTSGGGRGGVSQDSGEMARQLVNLMGSLQRVSASVTGGAWAEVDVWYDNTINKIGYLAKTDEEAALATTAATEAKFAMQKKLEQNYNLWVAWASGDRKRVIELEAKAAIDWFGKSSTEREEISKIFYDKEKTRVADQQAKELSYYIEILQARLSMHPVLNEEIGLTAQIIQLDYERSIIGINILESTKKLEPATAEIARNAALARKESREYLLNLQKAGSLEKWAGERPDTDRRRRDFGVDMMRDLEGLFAKSLGGAIMAGIKGKDLKRVGENLAEFFVDKMAKLMAGEVFDVIAKMFKSDAISGLGGDMFSGAKSSIDGLTSYWELAQENMTAASVAGGAARTSTLATQGGTGISILGGLAKSSILMDAAKAAASAYSSVMAAIPFPFNAILAPIVATVAFAAVAAYSAFGGSMGSSSGSTFTDMGAASAYHSGGIVRAHAGWPSLRDDEVPIIALMGERILSRSENRLYEKKAGGRSGNNVSINVVSGGKDFSPAFWRRQARFIKKALDEELNTGRGW